VNRRKTFARRRDRDASTSSTTEVSRMLLAAFSTVSILSIVAFYNGLLLAVLALYLWNHRGRPWER
jgi:hypothetical protein